MIWLLLAERQGIQRGDKTRAEMNYQAFMASLSAAEPPAGLSSAAEALWHERRGNWDRAHRLAQSQDDPAGYRVHAYLHRVEGDFDNAAYWYGRAGIAASQAPLRQEWEEILRSLLPAVAGGPPAGED